MLKEAIYDPSIFCITWEQIPGKGANEKQQEAIVTNAAAAAKSGKIHALGITDNPGGNPSLSVELLCAELKRQHMEPLVHFACRDKNRNAIESMLYGLERCKARNLLVISGDFPSPEGFGGTSQPVFDLDPVHVLQLIEKMNSGLHYQYLGREHRLQPTSFFAGVGISPFKKTEAELAGQYYKLRKKVAAGARFAITQIGFDARKFHELLLWLQQEAFQLPLLANLFVLTYPAAKHMYSGNIPGCIIHAKVLEQLAEEQKLPDKGLSSRIIRTAKLYAVTKGLGYAGAHIGGHNLRCETILEIIERGEEFHRNWQDILNESDYTRDGTFYYYFTPDPVTKLNTTVHEHRLQKPVKPLSYIFFSFVHWFAFDSESPLCPVFKAMAKLIAASTLCRRLFGHLEHIIKVALFRCIDCGDCALFDIAYLCPMSQCAKFQRNGPCGGSDNGWCEVYPNEKKCIWVRAYERLKADRLKGFTNASIIPPCDWQLWQSSSWLNYFLDRDHTAKMRFYKK